MLASVAIDKARTLLKDPASPYRWSDAVLLGWLSDAQRAIATMLPDTAAKQSAETLLANSTDQTLPSDAVRLLDVRRNLGTDGATPGKPIRQIDWKVLRAFESTWHYATGEAEIDAFVYRPEVDRLTYQVYPRPHATTVVQVDMLYVERYADLAATSTPLAYGEEYLAALVDYTVARALGGDDENADEPKSARHAGYFAAAIGAMGGN